jgi:hypothetical protein
MPPALELCAPNYAGRLLGCSPSAAVRRLGAPCAEMAQLSQTVRLYRVTRVLAFKAGLSYPIPDEPLRFFSALDALRTIEQTAGISTTRHRLNPFLGEPSAILVASEGEKPLWTQEDINAAVVLIGDSPAEFKRARAFMPRVSAKKRQRLERRRRSFKLAPRPAWKCARCGTMSRVHFCRPVHVDPIPLPPRVDMLASRYAH